MSIIFKPYETANATLLANGNSIIRKKIKFEKPSKAFEWEKRMYECAYFCKISKSVYSNFFEIRKQYHVRYSTSALYTSYCWTDLDLKNYNIIINVANSFVSGYGRDLIDQRVDFHTKAEREFNYLLTIMRSDLPSDRFDSIIKQLKTIADVTTY
jgi:hypothetical protein